MTNETRQRLLDALLSCQVIDRYTAELDLAAHEREAIVRDAVERCLVPISPHPGSFRLTVSSSASATGEVFAASRRMFGADAALVGATPASPLQVARGRHRADV